MMRLAMMRRNVDTCQPDKRDKQKVKRGREEGGREGKRGKERRRGKRNEGKQPATCGNWKWSRKLVEKM